MGLKGRVWSFFSGLWPAGFSLCIVAVMLVMFWQERFPSEVIALSRAALFLVTGILPYETALQVFSNPAPWTIGAMFIVVAALVRTGALDALISAVQNRKMRHPGGILALLLLFVLLSSAVVSNTPVVVVMIPVFVQLARSLNIAASNCRYFVIDGFDVAPGVQSCLIQTCSGFDPVKMGDRFLRITGIIPQHS